MLHRVYDIVGSEMLVSPDGMAAVAEECGKIMLSAHEDFIKTTQKTGFRDLVTEYDRKIQALAVEMLSETYPNARFICEEGDADELDDDSLVFIIDPIDGTANFTHHYGHSCISIGCTQNGIPTAGVVYDPLRDDMFTAGRGRGAFLNDRRIHISDAKLADTLVLFGTAPYNLSLADETLAKVRSIFGKCQDIRRSGSAALDLCYVAAGRAGLYFELELSLWDYAAGALIAQEAGATVLTIEGQELDFTNRGKSSIIAGSKERIEESGLL